MSKVVGIRPDLAPPSFEPNERVVAVLEELLSAARAGEVQGVAITVYYRDDTHTTARAGLRNLATYGNIDRLKFGMLLEDAQR